MTASHDETTIRADERRRVADLIDTHLEVLVDFATTRRGTLQLLAYMLRLDGGEPGDVDVDTAPPSLAPTGRRGTPRAARPSTRGPKAASTRRAADPSGGVCSPATRPAATSRRRRARASRSTAPRNIRSCRPTVMTVPPRASAPTAPQRPQPAPSAKPPSTRSSPVATRTYLGLYPEVGTDLTFDPAGTEATAAARHSAAAGAVEHSSPSTTRQVPAGPSR